jgi:hypothetical protein
MGKIVVSENVTLDGVVQDPAGAEGFGRGGWVGRVGERGRDEAAKVLLDEALGAEAQLFGRRTYEFLAARWPTAHRSAAAMVFVGRSGFSTCGKIEKSTTPSVLSPAGECQLTKSGPIRGVITMLPALTPTQTLCPSDGRRSARPDARIQWHKYAASPPSTSRTSVSRTMGTQRSSPRLGSAVSFSTPKDFQPSPTHGGARLLSADEPPRLARTGHGMPV